MSVSDQQSPSPAASRSKDSNAATQGFRSFWNKFADRSTSSRDGSDGLRIVQQDPSAAKKSGNSKAGRARNKENTTSSITKSRNDRGAEPASAAQKRRQQVYQAQKRHRDRKSEYIKTLEAEVARLKHLDAVVSSQKNALASQNRAIREYLASQSIPVPLDSLDLSCAAGNVDTFNNLPSAQVNVRFDPEIGHDRTFLDLVEFDDTSDWTTTNSSAGGDVQTMSPPAPHAPIKGDSWAALDFILALEWPCKDHHNHAGINPKDLDPQNLKQEDCGLDEFHGHAMTATAAVYQSSQAIINVKSNSDEDTLNTAAHDNSSTWELSHAEIDKLVRLSESLGLDDEQTTPAQAYAYIREVLPSEDSLPSVLQALKHTLSDNMSCFGFGAAMPTDVFMQHLHTVLPSTPSQI